MALLEPQNFTIDSDSNEPTNPYGIGNQHQSVPSSLNDLNLPPNAFNVLATVAVIQREEEYSPQSSGPSILSPISMPPVNLSTFEGWETLHTTTCDIKICCEDKRRRVYWDNSPIETFDTNEPRHVSFASSPSSTQPPRRQQKNKMSLGMAFSKKQGV